MYAKKELLEKMQPFLYGGDMIREVAIEKTTFADLPSKFEAGTINIAGIISLGAAIDYISGIGFKIPFRSVPFFIILWSGTIMI